MGNKLSVLVLFTVSSKNVIKWGCKWLLRGSEMFAETAYIVRLVRQKLSEVKVKM